VLSFIIASTPAHGTLSGIPPYVVYTPAPGFHGSDSFTFTANVGAHASAPATISIAVAHVNQAPVLTLPPGQQTTRENTVLEFSSADANAISLADEDSEGAAEQLTLEVAHGSLELGSIAGLASVEGQGSAKLVASGSLAALQQALELVSYEPAPDYQGSDSLKLEADDLGHTGVGGAKTVSESVLISVLPVAYDQATGDSYSTEENETLKVGASGVLANDTDSESLPLSAEVVEAPEHGTLTLNSDGSFEYAPDHNYFGTDSFTYRDQDGNTPSNVATVALTVNKVVFDKALNDSYSTPEHTKLEVSAPGVLANDKDEDSPPLALKAMLVNGPAHGALTLEEDGSFSYMPEAGYHGSDSFTYKGNDGNSESNLATVSLTVEQVDQAPSNTVPGAQSTAENSTLVFSSAHSNAISVSDGDAEGESEQVVLGVSHGTLALGSTTALTVAGEGSSKVTLGGTLVALNKGLEGLVYTPVHDYHGGDSLEIETNDLGHTGLGGPKSASASIGITVTAVEYDTAVGDSYSANQNKTLTVAATGVLANDTDSESLPLSAEVVTGPAHGSLTLNADGSFKYTPEADYSGNDSFTYRDQDGNTPSNVATVTITVNKVTYDTAVNDSYSIEEGVKLEVPASGVLANDTDSHTPPLPLKAILVSGPARGTLTLEEDGSFVYTPSAGYHGADSFTYKDEDGNTESNTATVTLAVEQVDRAPSTSVPGSQTVAENSSLTFASAGANAITVEDVDSEGEVEQVALSAAHGTLVLGSSTGLTVSGEGSAKVTINGTIAALNAGLEGLVYKPAQDYNGSDSLEVEVDDLGHTGVGGPKTASGSIPIAVTTVVYAEAHNDSYGATENQELKVAAPGVLANDQDSDTPALALEVKEVIKQPQHGTVSVNSDGSFKYTPESSYAGSDSFSYTDTDGNSESNEATVTIEVNAHTNEAPTVSAPGAQELNENTSAAKTSLVFSSAKSNTVSVADADAEGGSEKVTLSVAQGTLALGSTTGLTVTGSGTGTLTLEGAISALNTGLAGLTYTPTLDYHGSDSLSLEIDDNGHSGGGGAKTGSGSVAITLAHPNPAPSNPTYSGAIGNTEFSVGVGGSGPDVQVSGSVLPETIESDGSTLKATAETIATEHGGSVSRKEDGTFTYQPPVGYESASDSFKYTETDSAGGKATGTATIKIANARVWYVNDAEAPTGTGESNSPFKALSSIGSASTGSGDVIFLYKGSATYTGGIKLKSSQTLEGQDQGLTLESHTLVAASGTDPVITNASTEAPGVSLASADTVNGIAVESAKADGIQGAGVNGEVNIINDTVSQSAAEGIVVGAASSGTLTLDVSHDTLTRQHAWGIDLTSGSGSTVLGTIAHNTIGEPGVASSGAGEGGAIRVQASGLSNTTTVAVSENTVVRVHGGYGIWLNAAKELVSGKTGATLNATVVNNKVEMLEEDSIEPLFAESGNGPSDPETICLHAKGNTFAASGLEGPAPFNADSVLLSVKENSTFKVQGTSGTPNEIQLAEALEKENTLSSLHGQPVFVESDKSFSSGTCPEP
ncbi:MAG: tandem-95 repeat protein, partial [Solirubrobacteraceae bacterium]